MTRKYMKRQPEETLNSVLADRRAMREEVEGLMAERQELKAKIAELTSKVQLYEYQLTIVRSALSVVWGQK